MKNTVNREISTWAIAAAVTATLALAAYLGFGTVTGRAADPAPPKKVYPGMFDIRAEAQKARQSAAPVGMEDGR